MQQIAHEFIIALACLKIVGLFRTYSTEMSVTLYIGMENIVMRDGKVVVEHTVLSPDGCDHSLLIDSKCGVISLHNPWSLRVGHEIFKLLADLLNVSYEETDCGMQSGVICDLDEVIAVCDSVIGTLRTFPELEENPILLVDPVPEEEEIKIVEPKALLIQPERIEGYIESSVSEIRELALIAKQKDAVVCYAFDSAN